MSIEMYMFTAVDTMAEAIIVVLWAELSLPVQWQV
jgi:hypothetical protein